MEPLVTTTFSWVTSYHSGNNVVTGIHWGCFVSPQLSIALHCMHLSDPFRHPACAADSLYCFRGWNGAALCPRRGPGRSRAGDAGSGWNEFSNGVLWVDFRGKSRRTDWSDGSSILDTGGKRFTCLFQGKCCHLYQMTVSSASIRSELS